LTVTDFSRRFLGENLGWDRPVNHNVFSMLQWAEKSGKRLR